MGQKNFLKDFFELNKLYYRESNSMMNLKANLKLIKLNVTNGYGSIYRTNLTETDETTNTTMPTNSIIPINSTIPTNSTMPTNSIIPTNSTIQTNSTIPTNTNSEKIDELDKLLADLNIF